MTLAKLRIVNIDFFINLMRIIEANYDLKKEPNKLSAHAIISFNQFLTINLMGHLTEPQDIQTLTHIIKIVEKITYMKIVNMWHMQNYLLNFCMRYTQFQAAGVNQLSYQLVMEVFDKLC